MPKANKVNFGLKNVHYALITYNESDVPTWGTPVHVPGAVSASLSREGSETNFYADNTKYWLTSVNNGYTGTLEMADFPVAMREALWNQTLSSTGKLLLESIDDKPAEFALMFEIDGDQNPTRYCFPRCIASRPNVESSTTNESTEPQTSSCDLTVLPVIDPTENSVMNGKTLYRTTADTPTATYTAFYDAVLTSFT